MAIIRKDFTAYLIAYMSGPNEGPIIDCYNGPTHVAKLCFHRNEPLPPNLLASGNVIYLRYLISQFNDIVEILRNEKPLYVQLSTPDLKGFIATSGFETVGENEGV
jgi:hypothetical protein